MNITNINEQFGEYLYQRLPKVYRDYDVEIERQVDGKKKIFKTLQEYLYCFAEGGFKPLLEDLEAIISLLDPMKCPEQFLPVMLQHFGLDFIEDIPVKFQRRLVQNIITLYRKKGTIPAVAFLARELSGFDVTITETERGGIEFALVKINAYEDEDAELLLAQDVVQRYVHLFLPVKAKAEVIVTYGFTEYICQIPEETEESEYSKYASKNGDYLLQKVYEDYDSHLGFVLDSYFENESCLLKDTVQEDFDHVKILNGLEETYSFTPFDIYSVTDSLDEGDFVYTNGICCEDTIITQSVTSSSGEVEVNIPASSTVSVNKLVGGEELTVLPIYKCETDLKKGTTLKFNYDGKEYGYYTLERDLYASSNFPTTFQLDIYNNMVKVYNQYFTETIDGSYDFTLYSGYGSYHTTMRNGFIATDFVDEIRIRCGYGSSFEKMDSVYFQPTTTPRIAFKEHDVYISLSDIITSAESAKEFVKDYPITIVAPSASAPTGTNQYTSFCGQTIAYKKLSDTPTETFITLECKVYTMDDRTTVFAYESPVFMQNSNISIEGDYGVKVHPEVEVNGETIKTTDHLKNSEIINYEIYGNSYQATRSGKNLFDKEDSRCSEIKAEPPTVIDINTYAAGVLWSDQLISLFKPNTTYTISCEFECVDVPSDDYTLASDILGFLIQSKATGYSSIGLTVKHQLVKGEIYHYSKTFTIPSNFSEGTYTMYVYRNSYKNSDGKSITASAICRNIQIEEGTSSTEYEQYGVMPSPEFPSEIQSVGDLTKNLFDIDAFLALNDNSTYYSKNENGELVQLKPDYRSDTSLFNYVTLSAGNYIISYSNTEVTKCQTYVNGVSKGNTKNFTLTETSNVGFKFYESAGTVLGYIQIEEGSTATEYEPYHKYDIPITVKGKNLFNKSISANSSIRNETVNTDNSYSIGILSINKICEILKPNTTYTISCEFECESIPPDTTLYMDYLGFSIYTTVSGYSTVGALIKKQLSVGEIYYHSQTFTTPLKFDSGGNYRFLLYRNAYKDADGNYQFPAIICRNIQIEEASSATAYEPYEEETTHIYLDEPLRKIGDYADYIDFKNQKVIRKVKEITFENITFNEYSYGTELDNTYHFYIRSMSCILFSSMFCNIMKAGDFSMNNAVDDSFFTSRYSNQGNGGIYLQIEKSLINGYSGESNAEKLKAFLIDKNAKLLYCTTEYSEENISLPKLTTPNSDTMDMFLETSLQPSNINISYYQNQLVPQNSEYVYDLGMPLISFAGYSESIEKIGEKYYLRSAIKEIDPEFMYNNLAEGGFSGSTGKNYVLWFRLRNKFFEEYTPFYFNMNPCKFDVEPLNTHTYDSENDKYIPLQNSSDVFDFLTIFAEDFYMDSSGCYGNVCVNQFRFLSGYALKDGGLETFKKIYNNMFRYSDIPPKFYIYDKYNYYGGETLTEITDKDIINKLNLLPIPQDYAIISSKGIKYSDMDIGVQSKLYY